jgi:hypothetical protein
MPLDVYGTSPSQSHESFLIALEVKELLEGSYEGLILGRPMRIAELTRQSYARTPFYFIYILYQLSYFV